jgi:hypothetical protein
MTTLLLLFAACAPEPVVSDDEPEAIPGPPDYDGDSDDHEPDAPPDESSVVLQIGAEGFLEIRGYGYGAEGELVVASPFVTLPVRADEEIPVHLPVAPPLSDAASGQKYATFAIALRAADSAGQPGDYIGLTDEQLVFATSAGDGVPAGWSLVENLGEEDEAWLTVDSGVALDASLVAEPALTLAGGSAGDVSPFTHLRAAASEAAGEASALDTPITASWSVSFADAPPEAARLTDTLLDGAFLTVFTYEDVDGDEARTDETVEDRLCVGPRPAVVAWFAAPADLGGALALEKLGVRTGWELLSDGGDGLVPTTEADRSSLTLTMSCLSLQ